MCSSNSSVKASAVQERRAKSTFSFDIPRSMSRVTRNRRFPCKAEASEERRLVGRTPYPRQGRVRYANLHVQGRPGWLCARKTGRAGRRGVDLSAGPDRALGGFADMAKPSKPPGCWVGKGLSRGRVRARPHGRRGIRPHAVHALHVPQRRRHAVHAPPLPLRAFPRPPRVPLRFPARRGLVTLLRRGDSSPRLPGDVRRPRCAAARA